MQDMVMLALPLCHEKGSNMKIKNYLVGLVIVLGLLSGMAYATDKATDKYEGIELTVNVNSASAEEIAALLKGIGLKKAQRIVEYRELNGHFSKVEDLANVKGIGSGTLEKNKERIKL